MYLLEVQMNNKTKQQRYNKNMEEQGFYRVKVWVHNDDREKVFKYCERLRKKRQSK
jgi:hypothetical protein